MNHCFRRLKLRNVFLLLIYNEEKKENIAFFFNLEKAILAK